MSRRLYTLLLYLLIPGVLLRLAWRGLKAPAYWQRWAERFGWFDAPERTGGLWVHAVSVGEAQAALPLIKALRKAHPDLPVTVTTTTPTGSSHVTTSLGKGVFHVYTPYDIPGAVGRFLDQTRPRVAVVMETEIWPNLFHACAGREIPLILANARLSARSARGYRRVGRLTRDTLARVSAIAAQGRDDAQRLIELGADPERVQVTGSIKFDVKFPASLHERAAVIARCWSGRPVWIAASTHEGEDEMLLDAQRRIQKRLPEALLVLVPRHPERFPRAAALCEKRGFRLVRRSEGRPCNADTEVYLGDSMGELLSWYAAADAAFVGGSLVPRGGHNVLEPAGLGLPVAFGPHMFNFADISQLLLEHNAAQQVQDTDELAEVMADWLGDASLRSRISEQGRRVVEQNRGALDRLLKLVNSYL